MKEHMGNFSRETETIKKKKKEIQELKSTITEVKN